VFNVSIVSGRQRRQFAVNGSVAACLNIVFKHGWVNELNTKNF